MVERDATLGGDFGAWPGVVALSVPTAVEIAVENEWDCRQGMVDNSFVYPAYASSARATCEALGTFRGGENLTSPADLVVFPHSTAPTTPHLMT